MAKTIAQTGLKAQDAAILNAVSNLSAGKLVGLPTETVYGLGVDALNEQAVQALYKAKGRPADNPLICHVSGRDMAMTIVQINEIASRLIKAFWPGPLALVLDQVSNCAVAPTVSAGLRTLAVRCPNHNITLSVIKKLNRPIAAPSANMSGKLSPTTAQDVFDDLGDKIAMVIDGGPAKIGIESTIVRVQGDTVHLLRPGIISGEEIATITGVGVLDWADSTLTAPSSAPVIAPVTAPGQMLSHYAPQAKVILNQIKPSAEYFYLGFGDNAGDLNLSPSGDLYEAAKNLFASLRKADYSGKKIIAVAPIPMTGVGLAINDRLTRAAAPRPNEGTQAK